MGVEESTYKEGTCCGCKDLTKVRYYSVYAGDYCDVCVSIMDLEQDMDDMLEDR